IGELTSATTDSTIAINSFFHVLKRDNKAVTTAMNLANTLILRGRIAADQGKEKESLDDFDWASKIADRLLEINHEEIIQLVPALLHTRASVLYEYGKLPESLADLRRAVKIQERLNQHSRDSPISDELASTLATLGIVLASSGNFHEAVMQFDRAIALLQPLRNNQRPDIDCRLAAAFQHRGQTFFNLGKPDKAVADYHVAVKLFVPTAKQRPAIAGMYDAAIVLLSLG